MESSTHTHSNWTTQARKKREAWMEMGRLGSSQLGYSVVDLRLTTVIAAIGRWWQLEVGTPESGGRSAIG